MLEDSYRKFNHVCKYIQERYLQSRITVQFFVDFEPGKIVGDRFDYVKNLFHNLRIIVWDLIKHIVIDWHVIINESTDSTWRTNLTGAQIGQPIPAWVWTATSTTPEKFCSHVVYCWNFRRWRLDFFLCWESYFCCNDFIISATAFSWLIHFRNTASPPGSFVKAERAFSMACRCKERLFPVTPMQYFISC